MLRCVVVALVVSAASAASSFAQVMYEPIRYQWDAGGRGDQKYYYGGVDPRVHAVAGRDTSCRRWSYFNTHAFDGGNSFNQPSPMSDRPLVFTDCVPFQDASRFGYTQADARNEAYANAPTYFRKADLLASAIPTAEGGWVVPANAPHVYMHRGMPVMMYPTQPRVRTTGPTTTTKPGQVIIIPKNLLDKKLKDVDKKPLKVASAK